ncbi:SAV_6107 family HEPN domain-containing protein [Cellulomonas sp. URHD0024]|uniref:SAV_6107 family HEPN domain-containing protein n=1 Tax=Cellulomonas sp. URHD0024 TaxID=1302620 RepID=UPI0018CAC479|nr:SAV_6107 family HEPN domain-containing protein [Cellulomonas sp. URHD0024]
MAQQLDSRSVGASAGPQSTRAAELLRRADAELVAAQLSGEAWELFTHAHLAALRAGAAVVAARTAPTRPGRQALRTVWQLLDAAAPELAAWSAYFADAAPLRSAVDAGRFEELSAGRAEQALFWAEDFVDAARTAVHGDGVGHHHLRGDVHALQAS